MDIRKVANRKHKKAGSGEKQHASDIRRVQSYSSDEPDPTISFFNKPHTISLLVGTMLFLLYVAFFTDESDQSKNIVWGICACCSVFIVIGVVLFKDGPFVRPHPAVWRAVLATNVLYEMGIIYLLFQSKSDARNMMRIFDKGLGVPLPEKSYAENCGLNYKDIMGGMDIFVLAHSLGWFGKAIIFRDNTICWILSIIFELCEYSLEHQLPNFAECWWDHWILDVLICNWLGIYVGMKFCQYFEIKTYEWNKISYSKTIKGKIKRAGAQFTPQTWTSYSWMPTKSLRNYIGYCTLVAFAMLIELNVFYLKYLLWVPPEHVLVIIRLVLSFLFGLPAAREVYEFYSNNKCKRIGVHGWLFIATALTELLVIIKFSVGEFNNPFPTHVILGWGISVAIIVVYGIYKFLVRPIISKSKIE